MTHPTPFLLLLTALAACVLEGGCGPEGDKSRVDTAMDADGDGVPDASDCEPWDSAISPDQEEVCDGIDNDCDHAVDDADTGLAVQGYSDEDGDGYAGTGQRDCARTDLASEALDCDDGDSSRHPGALERCDTAWDDDCDGLLDAEGAEGCAWWYVDEDGDGYGSGEGICQCSATGVYSSATGDDCDDSSAARSPGDGGCGPRGEILIEDAVARIDAVREYDGFGGSLADVGDVNGDGLGDLMVGAYSDDEAGTRAGAAYLFLGPLEGRTTSEDADARVLGSTSPAYFGVSLAGLGDLDGDGYADVLVGTLLEDAAWLLSGPISGVESAATMGEAWRGLATTGARVAQGGDMDGDGIREVLIGAPSANVTAEYEGVVYVYSGGAPSGGVDLDAASSAVLRGGEGGDYFGGSVAGDGDADGDGVPDVLVGAPGMDVDGGMGLFLGPVAGDVSLADADLVVWLESSRAGWAAEVAFAGDTDGDGLDDLLMLDEAYEAPTTQWVGECGRVGLFTGGALGRISFKSASAQVLGGEEEQRAAPALSGLGDLDGDLFSEIAVSAYRSSLVFYGPLEGQLGLESADARIGTSSEEAGTGGMLSVARAVPAGDLTGDGRPDLIVGTTYLGPYRLEEEVGPTMGAALVFSNL